MTEKIYLHFLILYGILSHGISETFAAGNIKESSHLFRTKRLVSRHPERLQTISIAQAPYVVQILKNNFFACIGNIILPQVILTAAHCLNEPEGYSIRSGSTFTNQGTFHNIIEKIVHPQYQIPNLNDLALLTVFPHIDIVNSPNRPIRMHFGRIPPRTPGHISSWGCIGRNSTGLLILPHQLRSITTSIISREECHHYHNSIPYSPVAITDKSICTLDRVFGNRCCFGDSGAPLVVSNELAGILSWNRPAGGPDIFINLSHPLYKNWILMNLPPNPYYPNIPHNAHNSHPDMIGHSQHL